MAEIEKTSDYTYPLDRIYFYLTGGCNLRCSHCWIVPSFNPDGKEIDRSLPLDLFQSVVTQAIPLGLQSVILTGGEALIHPEIEGILDTLKAHKIRLTMETNGVYCTKDMARKIADCRSGWTPEKVEGYGRYQPSQADPAIAVSLDGSDADVHEQIRRVEGSFEDTIRGIKNLVEVDVRPQIIMTIMQQNKHQMKSLVELAGELNVGSVKFNILQPSGRGAQLEKDGECIPIEELVEIGAWVEDELIDSTDLLVVYSHPVAFRPLSRIFDEKDRRGNCVNCGILSSIGVLHDGSYAMCGIGVTVPELIYGNAKEHKLEDVWNNGKVLNDLRGGLPQRDVYIPDQKLEGVCGSCSMKGACHAFCMAQNYRSTGSLWEPFWYCDQAYKKGLFPKSRLEFNSPCYKEYEESVSSNSL